MSCPDCFKGTVHEGTPKGITKELHGRKTYIAESPQRTDANGVIVIVPDAFGWEFVNNRLLADHYAEKGGFRVYLPDFMDGRPAPEWMIDVFPGLLRTDSVWAWISKPYWVFHGLRGFVPFMWANGFGTSYPKVTAFVKAVREAEPAMPIGAAGFCWGGKHAINLAHSPEGTGEPLVDAVFTGHPSGLELSAELEKIRRPVSVAIGDKDFVVSMSQVEDMKRVFRTLDGVETEVQLYHGAGHGFCVRADLMDTEQEQHSKDAEDQAVTWFDRMLKKAAR